MVVMQTPAGQTSFVEKLTRAIARNQSLWCLGLDPNPEIMPDTYRAKYAADATHAHPVEDLWDWIAHIIETTADWVCAYKPTLGFYTALGAGGLVLLERTLAAIPPHLPIILDAKHADLNSSSVLAKTAFEQWRVDAITLSPYLGQELAARFLMYPGRSVFVSCYGANSTAQPIQSYPGEAQPLYLDLVRHCQGWGSREQLGLEVGAANPAVLATVRSHAPERLILARSIWASPQETRIANLRQILEAGLDGSGGGLILPVNQDALAAGQPDTLVRSLREETLRLLDTLQSRSTPATPWMPDVCLLDQQPHSDLILQLFDIGCIAFGEYIQASGQTFPYYIDLRRIISNPQVFDAVITAYGEILQTLSFDRIAGIPYGSLPTASGLALRLNRPLIFPRKEVKAYGARRLVEGNYETGETAVVVDDILITGKSVMEGAAKLQSCGLKVQDIVVLIDHEGGVENTLAQNGYQAHAVLTLSEINQTLYNAGRLSEAQFQALSSEAA